MAECIFLIWAVFVIMTAISFAFEHGTIIERLKAAVIDVLKLFGWGIAIIAIICLPLIIFGTC